MPFREAHHVTGQIVSLAEAKGIGLSRLALEDMQEVEPRITEEIFSVLSVQNSVKSRKSFGGTAPSNVRKVARNWIKRLDKEAKSG
jgi:argininosuccinate lyase